jgi:predicted acylesterase/phospholipase RssA
MSGQALIISGGGAKGAWGVGVSHALVAEKKRQYNTVIGTSTGSLMGPLILGGRFEELRKAYSSVTQDDIFNVNPFKKDGGIKLFKVVMRILRGKQSLGESENLKSLIRQFVGISLYHEIMESGKNFGATVTALKAAKSCVKRLGDGTYEDIIDWIWASANQPLFMSLLKRDGDAWVDGGLKDFVSIKYIIENKLATDIDVIIHNTPEIIDDQYDIDTGILSILFRTISIFSADVAQNDIASARLNMEIDQELNIHFYFMKKEQVDLIGNSLLFDPKKMKRIMEEGYASIVDGTCTVDECHITKDGLIQPGHA